MINEKLYTVEEARLLSPREQLEILMDTNGMIKPFVYGRIQSNSGYTSKIFPFMIETLSTFDGEPLKLPLKGAYRPPTIPLQSLKGTDLRIGDYAVVGIEIYKNRKKDSNTPFSIAAVRKPERLEALNKGDVVFQGDKVYLPGTIFNSEISRLERSFAKEKERLQNELDVLVSNASVVSDDLNVEKVRLIKAQSSCQYYDDAIEEKKQVLLDLNEEKVKIMDAYEKLFKFAQDRARPLLALDLITQEQLDVLFGGARAVIIPDNSLSWEDDLAKDYSTLVSVIHCYLFQQGIIYPRWLIGNFLTLLRTNDLIILSGLSGAGKTQIVKSFAEALGGKAHIIPVKPNWTSSEDLLGFFNSMQKTYFRTPFLEAMLEARCDPHRLHLICLDEMNLARVEYYFADFLSALEERNELPSLSLYPKDEVSHVEAEVRFLLASLFKSELTFDEKHQTLEQLLESEDFRAKMKSVFGENSGESFPAFHGRVRRAFFSIIDIPFNLKIPSNVRFIGAVNIDQTTYQLSPKILDRAHVVKFDNPLQYSVDEIRAECDAAAGNIPRIAPVFMSAEDLLPVRQAYPEYDENHPAVKWVHSLYQKYLGFFGIDVSYRVMRQVQHYWDLHAESQINNEQLEAQTLNFITRQKILPRFTFDGKKEVKVNKEKTVLWDLVNELAREVKDSSDKTGFQTNMYEDLQRLLDAADSNDRIFNYWA